VPGQDRKNLNVGGDLSIQNELYILKQQLNKQIIKTAIYIRGLLR
jgi:hypothetical protein